MNVADVAENVAPEFAAPTVTVTVDENDTAVYQASATDGDSDGLAYTLGGTDQAAFDIAADGTVTFKVAPDYEVDPTTYSFTVTADDNNGGTAVQAVTVNVADVAENVALVAAPAVTVTVDENDTAVYQASATDGDSDGLTYTLGGTDQAAFDIAADGTVTFKVAPDYGVDPTTYSFTVTADDNNGGTAVQAVTVNVADVTENVAPEFAAPTVTVTVDENDTAVYQASATDGDSDGLTYTAGWY